MTTNIINANQILSNLSNDQEVLTALYQFLSESIKKANEVSTCGWVVYEKNNSIVLSIRNVYTFRIGIDFSGNEIDGVALMVAKEMLTGQLITELENLGCAFLGEFKNTKGSREIIIPAKNKANFIHTLKLVRPAHKKYITNVLRSGSHTSWPNLYNPEIIQFLRETLKINIPDPEYYLKTGNPINRIDPQIKAPIMVIFDTIDCYLKSKGYFFSPVQIASFYTALQTKGFVILSGISGTGKTKLAQYFAEMLQTETEPSAMREKRIALVGAVGEAIDDSEFPMEVDAAEYWTFPINGDALKDLTLPFHLYLNHDRKIRHVFTVSDFKTQSGSKGMLSPWPDITNPEWRGREEEAGNPNKKYKTWLRISRREILDEEFYYSQLNPLYGYSRKSSALRGSLVPVIDPLGEPTATTEKAQHLLFLSVRPDWRDSKSLLGYYNPLTKSYEQTDFVKHLLNARQSYDAKDGQAWFVILDEMNLARVEYYFADLLSVLESGRDEDGYTREPLRFQYGDLETGNPPPPEIKLPPNLYIVGTVNVDETTQSFSPKVLDRAFSIEFTEVDFQAYKSAVVNPEMIEWDRDELLRQFTRDGRFAQIDKEEIKQFVQTGEDWTYDLQALNECLQPFNLHFGYRVYDEIMAFLMNAIENGMDKMEAFDQAVLMKVLPKFHGSRGKLEKALHGVLAWCFDAAKAEQEAVKNAILAPEQSIIDADWYYPATAHRVLRMLQSLNSTGFASFG